MAKKPNDRFVKIILLSPKMSISKPSKRQKFEDKASQKMITV